MQINKVITCRPMMTKPSWWYAILPLPSLIQKPQHCDQKWQDPKWIVQGQASQMHQMHVWCNDKTGDKRQRWTMSYCCHDQNQKMHLNWSDAINELGFIAQLKGKLTVKWYKYATIFIDHFCCLKIVHPMNNSDKTVQVKWHFKHFATKHGQDQAPSMWQWLFCQKGIYWCTWVKGTKNYLLWC